jgi:dipeptidyl aminopeptidase/acylaminoacyl peptidase
MKRFLARLAFIIVTGYIFLIAGLSFLYTENLLHPACPASATAWPGFDSVTLTTTDGLELQGWWKPPHNGAVILLLGGLGANRDAMLPEAEVLAGHGYGVLTLDYRHCAGAAATVGYHETAELQAMRDFALSQPETEWLGVLGFSVGGATAIRGAAHMHELQAVIAEGNYANFYDELTAAYGPPLSLQWQVQHLVIFFFRLRSGIDPRQINPIDDLPAIAPRPLLLIHGELEADRSRAQQQYDSASLPENANASLWIVPDAGHGDYRRLHQEEYDARIVVFFNEAREE